MTATDDGDVEVGSRAPEDRQWRVERRARVGRATAPRPDAGRPGDRTGTPPDHSPSVDPDRRIDDEAIRSGSAASAATRARRRHRQAARRDRARTSARPRPPAARPLGAPPAGALHPVGRQRAGLLHEHDDRRLVRRSVVATAAPVIEPANDLAQVVDPRARDAGVRVAVIPRTDEQPSSGRSGARTGGSAGSGSRRASRR